ncbi:unnamed protein product, partial [Rotaria sordida]
MAKAMQP